jgi:hypothetical protein
MAEQWFYRMFGHDFGPVGFDELKQLADVGSIASADEVRQGSSSDWVVASSVVELGLGDSNLAVANHTAMAAPAASMSVSGADDWYCMFHGQELGPIGFDELVGFAESSQISAEDEVRLGATGKWRKVGSIGRLVAVLPYHEPPVQTAKTLEAPAAKPVRTRSRQEESSPASSPSTASTESVPTEPVPTGPSTLELAQAAYAAADEAAKSQILWAFAPNIDPAWWGWIGGIEYGPVGFLHVYEWAMTGRLQQSDFVKNGMYGQYVPALNVPGLFAAVSMMIAARDALKSAEATAAASTSPSAISPVTEQSQVASVEPAPAKPTAATPAKSRGSVTDSGASIAAKSKSQSGIPVVSPAETSHQTTAKVESPAPSVSQVAARVEDSPARPVTTPEPANVVPAPVTPQPVTLSAMTSSSSRAMSAPVSSPPRPTPVSKPSRASSGVSLAERFQDPNVKIGLGALVAVLLVVGFFFLPKSTGADIERYRQLKQLMDDIRSTRSSGSGDFTAIKTRAKKITDEFTVALKDQASNLERAKQSLLWGARDELPRVMAGDLTKESPAEKNLELRLKEAAAALGVQ